jgi:hypothetical protein
VDNIVWVWEVLSLSLIIAPGLVHAEAHGSIEDAIARGEGVQGVAAIWKLG